MKWLLLVLSFAAFGAQKMKKNSEFKFDFSDFQIATAEYADGPTGMTLFHFPKGGYAAVDIRGGAAAVREASSIDELNTWGYVDAIVLAGGSTYGLESASGVMASLLEKRKGKTDFINIPAVPAAIVYDFKNRKNESKYPDKELGKEAFKKLQKNKVIVGQAGAGVNVTVGKYFGSQYAQSSGQGAAFYEIDGVKIFVLTVLNAVGNIFDKDGKIVRGTYDEKAKKHFDIAEGLMDKKLSKKFKAKENTTISIVITNAKLERTDLKRIAVMAHTGMAQSIRPFHTPWDGDTLFVVSTKTQKVPKELSVADLGTISAKLLNDAILNAISY